ncbi:hypothetical protein NM688_g3804 [Phlebia brevispora]|uniref:Uncharacterized protein n=1 Tax=Phlebia brevispora TaxID=194682 RepID=A0ACC1T4Q1_9APHY|nr:hypothetical protein NM688_g3804 [Phlebia brevispora]
MFKPRLHIRPVLTRAYATRLPERPRFKVKDPLLNNPHAAYQELPGDLTFIHRPPPSAASPESYTTAPTSPLLRSSTSADVQQSLPPVLFPKSKPEPPRMSDENLAEMRRLRAENPSEWTAGKLAKKFDCTQTFVRLMAPLKKVNKRIALAQRDAEHAVFRERWGEKKKLIKDIRDKRKEFW